MRKRYAWPLVGCSVIVLLAALGTWSQQKSSPGLAKGILDVRVLDADGKPLSGVAVSVPGYRSTTGLGGTSRFGLLPGRYSILISKSGYRGRRVNAGVRPGETTTTRVILQKLPGARPPKK